jgi:hypothetical protein
VIARADRSPFVSRAPGGARARGDRRTGVFALLAQRGYTVFARSRHDLALRRG